jgi:GT2 family glycosyltransferase
MLEGSMIFGRTEIFRQLKGFREEFFVYGDDEELSWRARKMGIELVVVPAACGWHANPGPYKFSPFIEHHKLKNYFALNLMYMPALPLLLLSIKYFLYTTVRKAFEGKSLSFLLNLWKYSFQTIPYYLNERLTLIQKSRQKSQARIG